jgi:uncharacterized glyoxalase superfamily protein PhnB
MPDGRLGHTEIVVDDGRIVLSDACPEYGGTTLSMLGGATVHTVRVASAMERTPVTEQWYGGPLGTTCAPP